MNTWELHPAVVHFAIAWLLAATALDVMAASRQRQDLARFGLGLLLAGEVAAVVAAAAGLLAYFTVPTHTEQAHVRMLIHPLVAGSAAMLFGIIALLRWKRRDAVPSRVLAGASLVAAGLLIAGATLGGQLVFHDGVGVARDRQSLEPAHEH